VDGLPNVVEVVLPGHRFDDKAEHDEAGIAVLVPFSRIEQERLVDEQGEVVLQGEQRFLLLFVS
jgi:hypothetical protein